MKKNIEMIEGKYKEKCKELNDNQKKNNEEKKQIEKELQKYRIELKNFKNTQGKKGLNNKSNNNDNTNTSIIGDDKVKEYEDQINQLTQENNQYKNNFEQIEKTQIAEYQKLLDESFSKIAKLNQELIESKDKNKYLEKALNIIEKTSRKNNLNFSPYINEGNDNNNDKNFLSKKRKIPKIYQDLIDNQQNNKNSNKETNLQISNEENNNEPIMEFSNFEI